MRKLFLSTLSLVVGTIGLHAQETGLKSSVKNVEAKVDSVLNIMTLEEKVGQMIQYYGSWDLTGPASETGNKQKEDRLKKGPFSISV